MKDQIIAKLCEIAIHVGLAEAEPTIDNVITGLRCSGCNKCDELAKELESLKQQEREKQSDITPNHSYVYDCDCDNPEINDAGRCERCGGFDRTIPEF